MSLEAAIQENTSVLKELLAKLSAGAVIATAAAPAPAVPATPAATPAPAADTGKTEAKALTYDADVKGPFLAFAKAKGREAAMKLLGEFKVQRADQVPEADWPKFIAAIATAAK